MTHSCLFCSNAGDLGSIGDLIYEDAKCAAVLHNDWAVPGHAMLIWKSHVENVSDLSDEDGAHFSRMHHALEKTLIAVTGAERAILMKLGIATPHLHLHIYPVPASLSRAEVFAIIDAKTRVERDEGTGDDAQEAHSSSRMTAWMAAGA